MKFRKSTPVPVSSIREFIWPAIPSGEGALILSLLQQLGQTQWWDPQDIVKYQLQQLQTVLRHAWKTVPFYRNSLGEVGIDTDAPLTMEQWRQLPILSRRDLQQHHLVSSDVPKGHGKVYQTRTSGSTGEPVVLYGTAVTQVFWRVFTMREHEWHNRDFSGRLAVIRPGSSEAEPKMYSDWGVPVNLIYQSGPSGMLSIATDISRQAEWLADFNPDYLLTFPSNMLALAEFTRDHGIRLDRLKQVRTISETVNDRLREACRDIWGVPLVDSYSSQELGYIASQCPDNTGLHIQSENVLVEILDDEGQPCRPGEVGRIIVSSLHNFATPLIRYELRDRAEAGDYCTCGRGLPVINRILGRERNMLTDPRGGIRWPMTGYQQYENITPSIRQFQFIQHTPEDIEVRLVVAKPLDPSETDALRIHIQNSLGYPFNIAFSFPDRLERSRSGKFEEFISHVIPAR